MSPLDELVTFKGIFGETAARRVAQLLKQVSQTRLRTSAELIRLHETVLYLRAYPQSSGVVKLADEILSSFAERLRGMDLALFDDPEISGMAGSQVSSNFSFEIVRGLVARYGEAVQID